MDYISTSSLANELDIKSSDLFDKLKKMGWIDRINDKWALTEIGKQKGGQTRTSQKYGEYIVWPENIKIESIQPRTKQRLLNSTTIGEHFNISNQRVNLVLSELGWIEKELAGWTLTKLGMVFNGKQLEHDTSGNKFVLWPEEILSNKHLLAVLNETIQEKQTAIKTSKTIDKVNEISIPKASPIDSFRAKYPPTQKTLDGHIVRSKSEQLIDNFLYINGIVHAYERKLPIEEDFYCDFYIPAGKGRPQAVYIEFWGLENDAKYLERKKRKIDIYKKYDFPLIELVEEEIQNLEEILTKRLIKHKVEFK